MHHGLPLRRRAVACTVSNMAETIPHNSFYPICLTNTNQLLTYRGGESIFALRIHYNIRLTTSNNNRPFNIHTKPCQGSEPWQGSYRTPSRNNSPIIPPIINPLTARANIDSPLHFSHFIQSSICFMPSSRDSRFGRLYHIPETLPKNHPRQIAVGDSHQ